MNKYVMLSSGLIHIKSGSGGQGKVSFRREKCVPKGGPDGGNGGNGGSVILKCSQKVEYLDIFNERRHFIAADGENGQNKMKYGKNAEDCYIFLPIGTEVYDIQGNLLVDLVEQGQEYMVAKGGNMGIGNMHLATSIDRTPRHCIPPTPGEEREILCKLKIIADVGLVGIPNSGKSSLINCLTNCHSPVGDYAFTTTHAHIGTIVDGEDHVKIVDIPGLIPDCSKGKGMGIAFLQNVERAMIIAYVINGSEDYAEQYSMLQKEISNYSSEILEKKQILIINKLDLISQEKQKEIEDFFKNNSNLSVVFTSTVSGENIDKVKDLFLNLKKEKKNP